MQPQLLVISGTGYQTTSLRANELLKNDHPLEIKMVAKDDYLDMVTVRASISACESLQIIYSTYI